MARDDWTCMEVNCTEKMSDWVPIAFQSPSGTMKVELQLCTMHIATLEISNTGQYMFLSPGKAASHETTR